MKKFTLIAVLLSIVASGCTVTTASKGKPEKIEYRTSKKKPVKKSANKYMNKMDCDKKSDMPKGMEVREKAQEMNQERKEFKEEMREEKQEMKSEIKEIKKEIQEEKKERKSKKHFWEK